MRLFVKLTLSGLLGAVVLLTAALVQAQACTSGDGPNLCGPEGQRDARAARRGAPQPRIIYGEHGEATFEFDSLRPLRRSKASSRQAYFGSGEEYSATLERLRTRLLAMDTRYRLEQLSLSPAQDAAKEQMPPALVRALTLAKQARESAATDGGRPAPAAD
jgi:hypothetical protein